MHLYSLGLTGIIGLFVVLMVVPAFSKEISKAASESVAIGLSQALEQQVVNLHTKILKTKHAFVSSCFIFVLSLLLMFVTMIIFWYALLNGAYNENVAYVSIKYKNWFIIDIQSCKN